MRRKRMSFAKLSMLLFALTFAGSLTVSGAASAQTDQERAGARAAATQGAEAFDAGNYKAAISYFERAQALVHAPPHLLFIARSHEKLGNLVQARETYLKIVRERLKPGDPEAFREAQVSADAELQQLEPRIPTITINVTGVDPGTVKVTMDGQELPSALVGVPMPIDPGDHQFEASAPGSQPVSQSASLAEGSKEVLELALQPGTSDGPAGSTTAVSAGGDVTADTGAAPSGSSLAVPAYIALGAGVVGVGIGTVFLIKGAGEQGDADDKFDACVGADGVCRDPVATEEIKDLDSSAASSKTIGVIGLTLGGAALATGVVLLILDGGSAEQTAKKGIKPVFGLGYAGISGRF